MTSTESIPGSFTPSTRPAPTTSASPGTAIRTTSPSAAATPHPAASVTTASTLSLDVGDTRASAQATGLSAGGRFVQTNAAIGDGRLGDADVDLYQFNADAGTMLTAITSQPSRGAAMNTVLRLFDAAGNPLAFSDSLASLYSQLIYTFNTAGLLLSGDLRDRQLGLQPEQCRQRHLGQHW